MEALRENNPAVEMTPRIKDQEAGGRSRQKVHALHTSMRPRPDDPNSPGKTQQETPRVPNESSQKPAYTPKTRLCPICCKPSSNKLWRRHIEEVHRITTVVCKECLKKYKTVPNRTKHKKKYHPLLHSSALVNH